MLEIIIALLMALGFDCNEESNIQVIDEHTGICYGVGTTVVGSQGTTAPPPTTFVLCQDASGKYYLVRR